MTQTIFYARVSTTEQNIGHQVAQARAAGFEIDQTFSDEGVSGVATKLAERPEGRRLFDKLREGDTLVVRWIDRLGRNYEDVTETMQEFLRRGVTIKTVINSMVFNAHPANDMEKAVQNAMLGFMAAMASAQAEATKIAQRAGIDHALATKQDAYRGRKPSFTRAQFEQLQDMVAAGTFTDTAIAAATGIKRTTVINVKQDMAKAEAGLARWGI